MLGFLYCELNKLLFPNEMTSQPEFKERTSVVVRFAGDSGDGMQIAGERFTDSSALLGNDVATFPDYPAEIRAPAGTIPGVSAFQVHFGSQKIHTPGDSPDALVAMNPAALNVHLEDLVDGGLLVLNKGAFTPENLKMADFDGDPVTEDLRSRYHVIEIDITELTKEALKDSPLKMRDRLRCKNFFALGLMYWIYSRNIDTTISFIEKKWRTRLPDLADANITVLKTGYFLGETMEVYRNRYRVAKAATEPGTYRKISGNDAIVLGLVAGVEKSGRQLLFSGYPITPASSILEGLAGLKHRNVKTVQAEDEIAAIGVAIGASYAGALGATGTSGPGMCLKSEFLNLAMSCELPLVVCNVQRGGPSTGLPTKTEQGDLMISLYGRNSDSPIPVIAAHSPSDCFNAALEAVQVALKYSTPVILLTDCYLANGAEPWRIPDPKSLPQLDIPFAAPDQPYVTFARDEVTLARTLAVPGQRGLEHRIGGLEKDEKGSVSYDPHNHEKMSHLRAAKVKRIARDLPPTTIHGDTEGDLLVVSWGGTYGAITACVKSLRAEGYSISSIHLRYLNPLPQDLGQKLRGFKKIVVPELNLGQLHLLLRAHYLVNAAAISKMQGRPFRVAELREHFLKFLHS